MRGWLGGKCTSDSMLAETAFIGDVAYSVVNLE
jgi:hypothetical protein